MGTKQWAPGTPSWVDVIVPNVETGKAFYSALFGWSFEDQTADGDWVYSMASLDGGHVAGLGRLTEQMASGGMPPVWTSYITTDDIAKTAERVVELGGTALGEVMEVMESGSMVVTSDPTGAVIAFWQPKEHFGVDVANEAGSLCWTELQTRDTAAAQRYYTDLLGWTATANEGPMQYTTFELDGKGIAGMMKMPPMIPAQVPANWLVYFAVTDCDAAVARVTELGGSVMMPPMDIPGTGRFSVVHDNQGAVFAVIKMEPMNS